MKEKIEINEGHILKDTAFIPAADKGGALRDPHLIVIHYTAGGNARGAVSWLTMKDDTFVSAHLIMGRDGKIQQTVPFDRIAFHAGRSEWNGFQNLNNHSIGIELVNWGPVVLGSSHYFSWTGAKVPKEEVLESLHRNAGNFSIGKDLRFWQRFTSCQYKETAEVCRALIKKYPTIKEIVGHDDIAPKRKVDPGPAFPMDWLKYQVFGKENENE